MPSFTAGSARPPASRSTSPFAYEDDATSRTFAMLTRCANFKMACPSNREIAKHVGLPAPASAAYQLKKLVGAKLIRVSTDSFGRRMVTIVASGKKTALAR